MKTKIIQGQGVDPWLNLAIEEHLLSMVAPNEIILYLWQNQNTVVIGKNQNPWRECRTTLIEQEGGKLARRLSGGGAVFHDLGNLNFTFIMDRNLYDFHKQVEVILDAVNKLGIPAEFSGRNDIVVEGKKFSGNAFCFRPASALHHGTVLLDADMHKLTRYLQVSEEKIRSKGVNSIQARVTNLRSFQPHLTVKEVEGALREAFQETYGKSQEEILVQEFIRSPQVSQLQQKYSSWNWRYGESPDFDIDLQTRFDWGGLELGLQLKAGKINKVYAFSDAMDGNFIEMLPPLWQETVFHSEDMAQKLEELELDDTRKQMAMDIASWLKKKEF